MSDAGARLGPAKTVLNPRGNGGLRTGNGVPYRPFRGPQDQGTAAAGPAVGSVRWRPLERFLTFSLIGFLAVLPLEWVTLRSLGEWFVKPFHIIAVVLSLACLIRWGAGHFLAPVLRRHKAVYGAYFLLIALTLSFGYAYPDPYVARPVAFRQGFYAATSLVIAALILRLVNGRARRALTWVGFVALAVLVGSVVVTLSSSHVNTFELMSEALRTGNPDVISYKLLRSTFRSDDIADAGANLRHKVFLAILVASYLGLALQPAIARRRYVRPVLVTSAVLSFVFAVLSLSRSTIVCLVLLLAIPPVRFLIRKRAGFREAVFIGVGLLLVAGVALSPVGQLAAARFARTDSYQTRLNNAGAGFFDPLGPRGFLTGISNSVEHGSPHNLTLDAIYAAGIVGGLCALVLVLAFLRVWLREAWRYVRGRPGWVLPVSQLWLLGIGIIPLVRAVTAGNQFHMVEWTAVGLFLGLTYANEREASKPGAAVEPVESGQSETLPLGLAPRLDRGSRVRGAPALRTSPR